MMRSLLSNGVSQVEVPRDAREVCTLPRVDYEDGFLLALDRIEDRTAEGWARAMLEETLFVTRRVLRSGWFAVGLELGSTGDEDRVMGWEMRRNEPDVALLGARSRLGAPAEVLFMRREGGLLFSTFMQHENPAVQAAWAAVSPAHRQVARYLLGQVS